MAEIKLNDILNLNDEQINNCKIELNMKAGKYGEKYIKSYYETRLRCKNVEALIEDLYEKFGDKIIQNLYLPVFVLSFSN